MAQLLQQCGVRQFDPRVAGQLLAVMRRHVREALGSAAYLASHAGRGSMSAADVEEASRLSLDAFLSRSLPSNRATRRLAQAINKEPLPPIRPVPTEAAAVTLANEGLAVGKGGGSSADALEKFKKTVPQLRTGVNFDLVPRDEIKAVALGKRKVGGGGAGGDEALPTKRRKGSGAGSVSFGWEWGGNGWEGAGGGGEGREDERRDQRTRETGRDERREQNGREEKRGERSACSKLHRRMETSRSRPPRTSSTSAKVPQAL